ncbi:hypothetical protein QNH48_19430 [Neobacillus sp. YX16]|uniref:hypothetical protein n=1 Tax=Neobacillus sp. YX16 TaxID=3047874 RepID=UPI0024C45F76|nr:hypothetical protein [Neobacillus sp. YX16]WHZ01176.1 hypothetical protein QNH48_19430 [Neobacillus sp. YX16]
MNQTMKLIIQKAKPFYYQAMSQLTPEQQIISRILFEIGASVREQAIVEINKNLFMDNVKYAIKKMKHNRSTFKPSLNQVKKTMKRLEQIGYMKLDEDGLPLWFYGFYGFCTATIILCMMIKAAI